MRLRPKQCTLALIIVAAFVGTASASAFAEGPKWLVNGVLLEAGKTVKALGKGSVFFAVLFGTTLRIECKSSVEKLTLIGGEPGKDEDVLQYKECVVTSDPEVCEVTPNITIEANTTLVYLVKKAGKWVSATKAEYEAAGEKALGDKLVGKGEEELLATFTVKSKPGMTCPDAISNGKLRGNYTGIVNGGLEFTSEIASNVKFVGHEAIPTGLLEYEGEEGQALSVDP
jgi:hypothetical protein